MADIEKVKQGLRCIAQIGECDCDHCDYADNGYPSALYKCQEKFASDALSVIEQMEQERRWIPVIEQMPHEREAVEIWLKYAKISITAFWMRNGDAADGFVWIVSEFERNRCYAGDVSHWRKPQPPKEGDGDGQ